MASRDTAGAAEGPEAEIWSDRVLCALDLLAALAQDATPTRVKEMVGARFASYFTADSRLYEGPRPMWEREVDDALTTLISRKIVARRQPPKTGAESGLDEILRITKSGRASLVGACERGIPEARQPNTSAADLASFALSEPWGESSVELPGVFTPALREMFFPPALQMVGDVQVVQSTGQEEPGDLPYGGLQITNPRIISADFRHQRGVVEWPEGLGVGAPWIQIQEPGFDPVEFGEREPRGAPDPSLPVVIELNVRFLSGLTEARGRIRELWEMVGGVGEPMALADQYMAGDLTLAQMEGMVAADAADKQWPQRAIKYIWPDFPMSAQLDASAATIKALPAQRSFGAFGDEIVWAVVDSGIQADHPHFAFHHTLDDPLVRDLHRDFTQESTDHSGALTDQTGHGTHVSAIIAGGLDPSAGTDVIAAEKRFNPAARGDVGRLSG